MDWSYSSRGWVRRVGKVDYKRDKRVHRRPARRSGRPLIPNHRDVHHYRPPFTHFNLLRTLPAFQCPSIGSGAISSIHVTYVAHRAPAQLACLDGLNELQQAPPLQYLLRYQAEHCLRNIGSRREQGLAAYQINVRIQGFDDELAARSAVASRGRDAGWGGSFKSCLLLPPQPCYPCPCQKKQASTLVSPHILLLVRPIKVLLCSLHHHPTRLLQPLPPSRRLPM
ncbi:hypothetical protein BKA70DRAFT_1335108 [Coprinopsis sp. MPI-PUGE-AT-0042]|nr:hypothetical protein BKA70DRAFT_1335108 [Coprinopsis sp. MPI-PUGE-AT-0042]